MNAITPKSSSQFPARLITGAVVSTLIVIFCLAIYLPNCKVEGYEFNPQTWQVRHFEFWADPFTNIQLGGVFHDTKRISIDSTIIGCLNKNSSVEADRWDLVELSDFRISPSIGPAAVIVDLITTHKYGYSTRAIQFWTDWTAKNPSRAPAFWQAAQTLTTHQAYHCVPDLLDQALVSNERFDRSLRATMSGALLQQARMFANQGNPVAASAAAKSGLQYDPSNPELIQLAK